MHLYEILKSLNELWQAQPQIDRSEKEQGKILQKIDNDDKRTDEEKQRVKEALRIKKENFYKTMQQAEKQLLGISHKASLSLLKQLTDNSLPDITHHRPKEMKNNQVFNLKVYRDIYPLLELIHQYEKRGVVSSHAAKLACIFKSKQDVLRYLLHSAESNKNSPHPVYDACRFPITEALAKPSRWLTLARQDRGINLKNPRFRILLKLSKDIEQQIKQDQASKQELLMALTPKYLNGLDAALEEINHAIKEKKTFCDAFTAGQLDENDENIALNKTYLLELDKLYNDRAILHLKKPFEQYSIQDLDDCYKRLLLSKPSKAIFTAAGIDDGSYQRFLALDRSKAGKNIPEVLLPCTKGYYIKKLNVQDDKEAAIAACLGEYTDCCQSLSGETGEPCVIHGLTSEDSGFYVLFKGNVKRPNIDKDEIYGQTWVNRTASGALLFDSIESLQANKQKKFAKIVQAAYIKLANKLIQLDDVPWVSQGCGSGIMCGSIDPYLILEGPKNYHGYRDSLRQDFLADKRSFIETKTDKWQLNFKLRNQELERCYKTNTITENMRYNILRAIAIFDDEADWIFNKCHPKPFIKEYFDLQWKYFRELTLYAEHPKNIPTTINRADVNARTLASQNSALTFALYYGHYKLVDQLINAKADVNIISKEDQTPLISSIFHEHKLAITKKLIKAKADVNLQNKAGLTALHFAVINELTEARDLLLSAGANPNLQDQDGRTALMEAVGYSDNNEMILQLLKAGADPFLKDNHGQTALDKTLDYHPEYADILKQAMAEHRPAKRQKTGVYTPGFWQPAEESTLENERIINARPGWY